MCLKQLGKIVMLLEQTMNSLYTDLRAEYLSEWRIWYKMIYSCRENLQYYLETQVCEEWQGPQGFINWFDYMGPRPSDEHVMDRINKLGDYEPGNVEWTTKQTSSQRQRRHEDPEQMAYWIKIARSNGIKGHTFRHRVVDYGWSMQDAATLQPSQKRYKNRTV